MGQMLQLNKGAFPILNTGIHIAAALQYHLYSIKLCKKYRHFNVNKHRGYFLFNKYIY